MSFRQISENGYKFLAQYPRKNWLWRAASRATIAATGIWAKLTIDALTHKPTMHNMDILLEAYKTSKLEGRGLITVMNHSSVLDEPLVWGMLPYRQLFMKDGLRWALGAENVCFTNKFFRLYFSLGQVLSTKRFGSGPFQGSIDAAINLLSPVNNNMSYSVKSKGHLPSTDVLERTSTSSSSSVVSVPAWVNIFPETFVHQPCSPYENTLKYFHWGVSRLILEASEPPIVIPIFTHGLEKIAPEDDLNFRGLHRRIGAEVEFNVGVPLNEEKIYEFRQEWLDLVHKEHEKGNIDLITDKGANNVYDSLSDDLKTGNTVQDLRSRLAKFVREGVEDARVELGFERGDPRFAEAEFWHKQREVKIAGKMHHHS